MSIATREITLVTNLIDFQDSPWASPENIVEWYAHETFTSMLARPPLHFRRSPLTSLVRRLKTATPGEVWAAYAAHKNLTTGALAWESLFAIMRKAFSEQKSITVQHPREHAFRLIGPTLLDLISTLEAHGEVTEDEIDV